MMKLELEFKKFIEANHLFPSRQVLLLAVSGGVDSVVLCELCYKLGYRFAIAHCNFLLRADESDADEQFVKDLAQHYGVPFFVKKMAATQYASTHKVSIQVAARALRYQWFDELLRATALKQGEFAAIGPLHYILTAHHADDNIETIAMNFFKGTGINGLKGIEAKQGHLIRPLLFAAKEDIKVYAGERQLSYREDSSNSSDKYSRNFFRNRVLPMVQEVYPAVHDNMLQNAVRFKEIHSIYRDAIDQFKKKLMVKKGAEWHIPVLLLQLTPAPATIMFEIIREYGFTAHQCTDVMKLLLAESGKYVSSPSHTILRNRKWLIIYPQEQCSANHYLIEADTREIVFPGGSIQCTHHTAPVTISNNASIALMDAGAIPFPLILRRWKPGDYFYPLGMNKKKKLSRFFIDQKIPQHIKEKIWVVESNKKILWVVGLRLSDKVKLTDCSTNILSLRLVPPFQTS